MMGKRTLCLAASAALLFGLVVGSAADAGLVSYWDFDGDAVATVGTDGVMVNGPTATTDRNGAAGGALAFNAASSQYVEVAGGGGLDGAYVGTISMWVKWSGAQDDDTPAWNYYGAVMGRQSNTGFSNNLIALGGADPASAGVRWGPAAAAASTIDGATAVGDDVWRHVAVVFQPHFSGASELFLDGISQGTLLGEPLSLDSTVPLSLGAWIGAGSSYATAAIDDVAIFDDMLSASQINELQTQTRTPLTVGEGTDVEVPLRGVVATASSEFGSRYADQTADGVGRRTTNPDSYELKGHPIGMWLSNGTFSEPNDLNPEITYDLGEVTPLSKMVVYNYNEAAGSGWIRGIKEAEIYTSDDGAAWDLFDTVEFDLGTGDATNPPQEVNLGGTSARYVKFDVVMASQESDFSFAGLSEVDFYAVPEPSVVALLLAGLVLLPLFRRN